jgi:uncharacterized protein (DUF58 family)
LFVKRFEEETNLRAQLIIDTSSSMLFPYQEKKITNKLFFSIYAAAALIRLIRNQRDAVGLTLFSSDIELTTHARLNEVHSQQLYRELTKLLENAGNSARKENLNRTTRAAEILHQLAELYPTRSMVILFSDMLEEGDTEELFSALQHLRYNKHEVILFHVRDHNLEEEFDYPARPHRFIDMESGRTLRVNPADIRQAYREKIKGYYSDIRLRCGQYDIDFVEADIRHDFSEVLLPFLIRRQKLF